MNNIENNKGGKLPDSGVNPTVKAETLAGNHRPAAHARKDRKQFHATHHGVHSRRLYEALATRGENVRELRRIELALRKELQPSGVLSQVFFDRMWACFLRCLLITIAEKDLFADENLAANFKERLTQANTMALATGSSKVDAGGLLNGLAVFQRYDFHNWREFNKALATLLELRTAGNVGLMCLLR
jgi:hypothetical protein